MADYEDDTGNSVAKPRSERSTNPVVSLTDEYFSLQELSYADSSYRSDSSLKPYNPDKLVQRDGDYSSYENMLDDDQVSVALELKKDLVLAAGYEIVANSDDDQTKEIQEFIEQVLTKDVENSFDDALKEMLSAYEFGFSLTEKVFKQREDGKVTLKFLKTRHPVTWLIHTDDKGNITRYEQRGQNTTVDIPPESLIHVYNNPKFGNPYGRSDLRSAYAAYFVKQQVIKYYAIFLEKSASPIPVARYNKDAPQSAVNDIFNALKKFQAKTALVIPKDIEVEFLKSENNGEAYNKAINIFNMFIGRALFIPDLLGFQGSETSGGSYALGSEQMDVLFKHIGRRRTSFEALINKEIIEPLVYINFGEVDNCPQFKLKPIREQQIIELCKLWLEAVKSKVMKPSYEQINYFNQLTKFPELSEEEIEEQEAASAAMQAQLGQDEELEPDHAKDDGDDKKAVEEEKKQDDLADEPKQFAKKFPEGSFHKKVNFEKIETSMDSYVNSVKDDSKPILNKAFKDLKQQLKRKRILETQNLDKIDTLRLKHKSELERLFDKAFKEQFIESQSIGRQELEGGNVVKKFTTPLLDEDFLEVLASETWQTIGDWEYQIKKKLRVEMAAAIKDGKPLSDIVDGMDSWGSDLTDVQIERYARTKFTEVMNRGRHSVFEESGAVEAYQYSAILDDRTSDICAGLDGKVFKAGSEPIPPMHFNCRSLLVPITKYEEWSPDSKVGSKPINEFINDNLGEGFSKQ